MRAWGDEPTFRAMATSLAEDGDLIFDSADESRLLALEDRSAQAVILQASPKGISYSKPPFYALFAAPFVAVAGVPGMWWANGAAFLVAAWLAFSALAVTLGRATAGLAVVTFLGTSVVPAMIAWEMSDLFQFSLALGGLALCFRAFQSSDADASQRGTRSLLLGAMLLGLLTAARYPNALILFGPLAWCVLRREFRKLTTVGIGAVLGFLCAALIGWGLQGTANPYKKQRTTFNHDSGYPKTTDELVQRFYDEPARQSMGLVPRWSPRASAYSALYFFVGRHSGLLWYFPAGCLFALLALRRSSALSLSLLAGAAACALFYDLYWPTNYFGGATFLGNRYIMTAYPMLLFAGLTRHTRARIFALPWAIAALVWVSSTISLNEARALGDRSSQSHTCAGIFRIAPYESTASAIEGRQDRYWSGDFLRFVDAYTTPHELGFSVHADRPAGEILIGSYDDLSELVLRVRTEAEEATLVTRERGVEHRFLVGRDHEPIVRLPLEPASRFHPFWFGPEPYHARIVRFRVESNESSADRPPSKVFVQYGSGVERLEKLYARELLSFSLAGEPVAGQTDTATLSLRNTSPSRWKPDDPFPVALSYRIESLTAGKTAEGPRYVPPTVLEPAWLAATGDNPDSDTATLNLPIQWPTEPGRYRLVVDLVIDGYAWFEDRIGEPLVERTVELRPAVRETGQSGS